MKLNEQIEMNIPSTCRATTRRQRRTASASWWFSQMRRAVDGAGACGTEHGNQGAQGQQAGLPLAAGQN
jgi:hypothetical protein